MLGIKVARNVRRKAKTTRMTSMTEMMRVNSISCTEARTVVVRSRTTFIAMAGEIEACNCGNAAYTRSTVAIMFAPGWREMIISTPGLPFASPTT